jgi:MFS transporter, UMF1 family
MWAWTSYDWANSAFATVVLAGFFPIFFKDFWQPAGTTDAVSTWRLGVCHSVVSGCVVLSLPLLGAIGDAAGVRKRLLLSFAALGVIGTGALALIGQGQWLLAGAAFVLAAIGFYAGNSFYDSLLVGVAPPAKRERVSALGYALGYMGGGLLLAVCVLALRQPAWFGAESVGVVRGSFLAVALWWGLFSIPLARWVAEPAARSRATGAALGEGLREVWHTIRAIRQHRVVMVFLLAYWLYIDAVDTIILMAVDYGRNLGFSASSLILALLLTQLVGFPASLLYGRLGERWGSRKALLVGLAVYLLATLGASQMTTITEFFILAGIVGLVQGGVQALSRAYFSQLIPPERSAEFFGFYNLLGKSAAIGGPLLMGAVGRLTGSPRLAMLSLMILFLAGGLLLLRVPPARKPSPT